MDNSIIQATILRYVGRFGLLIVGSVVFTFALLSGSEAFGGGWWGIMLNSPNALPWALLLGALPIAWYWEFTGGVIISVLGILMAVLYLYPALYSPMGISYAVVALMLSIQLFGGCFIGSWYLRKKK